MIGFSIDIDLTTVFPRLSRAPCPPTLPAPLEERLPLRLQDGRRVSIASGGPYRLRVGVYLNLKLEDRSGAIDYTPPFPSRSFSSNSWLLSIVSKPATSLEKLINSCLSLSLSLWFFIPPCTVYSRKRRRDTRILTDSWFYVPWVGEPLEFFSRFRGDREIVGELMWKSVVCFCCIGEAIVEFSIL